MSISVSPLYLQVGMEVFMRGGNLRVPFDHLRGASHYSFVFSIISLIELQEAYPRQRYIKIPVVPVIPLLLSARADSPPLFRR